VAGCGSGRQQRRNALGRASQGGYAKHRVCDLKMCISRCATYTYCDSKLERHKHETSNIEYTITRTPPPLALHTRPVGRGGATSPFALRFCGILRAQRSHQCECGAVRRRRGRRGRAEGAMAQRERSSEAVSPSERSRHKGSTTRRGCTACYIRSCTQRVST